MKPFYLNFDADIELEEDNEIDLEAEDDALAFDRRTVDVNGRMTVPDCIISKSCVSPYFGREIPGYDVLGLSPDSIYMLYRDAKELAAAAGSFEAAPLMLEHVATTASNPQKPLMAGVVSNVRWKAPYLVGDICVWDADADMTPGTAGGERYDGRMVSIVGNHVALVQEGRVGPEAKVRE
jgi:hypothetical protein